MTRTIESYIAELKEESRITQSVLDALRDESLSQEVSPLDRTLGEIAWHVVTSMYTILSKAGLLIPSPGDRKLVPATANEIAESYRVTSSIIRDAILAEWTNDTLLETRHIYEMIWPVAQVLDILIKHEIHHRGQLSILMRQAGLDVPDIYGPARKAYKDLFSK